MAAGRLVGRRLLHEDVLEEIERRGAGLELLQQARDAGEGRLALLAVHVGGQQEGEDGLRLGGAQPGGAASAAAASQRGGGVHARGRRDARVLGEDALGDDGLQAVDEPGVLLGEGLQLLVHGLVGAVLQQGLLLGPANKIEHEYIQIIAKKYYIFTYLL